MYMHLNIYTQYNMMHCTSKNPFREIQAKVSKSNYEKTSIKV